MALATVLFPESRTLTADEGDAYLVGTAPVWYAGTPEASAAYDPAYVLPCMVALLRSQALTPARCAAGGWLALALRCLAVADDALRCACPEHV